MQQDLISKLDIDDVLPLSCNDDSSSSDGEDNDENSDEDKVVIINDTISCNAKNKKLACYLFYVGRIMHVFFYYLVVVFFLFKF